MISDIQVGQTYLYTGSKFEDETNRLYSVISVDSEKVYLKHITTSRQFPLFFSRFDWKKNMELVESCSNFIVISRIKLIHSRQAAKHKFFNSEISNAN